MAASASERRQDRRYPVRLPVELGEGTGVTRDASAGGVFFETTAPVRQDRPLTFALRLEQALPDASVRLGCTGRVVRIERGAGRTGVGVALTSAVASRDDRRR